LDYIVIGVLTIPIITGFIKGFMRMIMGLIGLIGGISLSIVFARPLGVIIGQQIGSTDLFFGKIISFLLIFLGCAFLGFAAGWLLRKMISMANLDLFDRLLGGVLGFVQGTVIASVILIVIYLLPITNPWLMDSLFCKELVLRTTQAFQLLPDDWESYLSPYRWIGESRENILEVLKEDSSPTDVTKESDDTQ